MELTKSAVEYTAPGADRAQGTGRKEENSR
jgi:hypothetical protein